MLHYLLGIPAIYRPDISSLQTKRQRFPYADLLESLPAHVPFKKMSSQHANPREDPSTASDLTRGTLNSAVIAPPNTVSNRSSETINTARQDASYLNSNNKSSTNATASAQLSNLTLSLSKALRQFQDFPTPGILFEDICPIFRNPSTLNDLITALELFIASENGGPGKPDLIVGLDARGFLIGPALALRIGAGFSPVRKKGKLPGKVERANFKKEYGEDVFEIQADAVEKGQKVLIIDDIIATGQCSNPLVFRYRLC